MAQHLPLNLQESQEESINTGDVAGKHDAASPVLKQYRIDKNEGHEPGSGRRPYLVIKGSKGSSDDEPTQKLPVLTKCKCGSSWCAGCFKARAGRRSSIRMASMKWNEVRHIVLTVDRKNYINGELAYIGITRRKRIPGLIRNLRRCLNKPVGRWLCFLEWHQDGYPHWHLICETKPGKKGQIGYENLQEYWPDGGVYETYPKNKEQWEKMTGYFQKAGYFDEKEKEQGRLPEWAIKRRKKIRRVNASLNGWDEQVKEEKTERKKREPQPYDNWTDGLIDEMEKMPFRGYEMILSSCGKMTRLRIVDPDGFRTISTVILVVPYADAVKAVTGFVYVEGVGLTGFCKNDGEFRRVMCQLMEYPHFRGFSGERDYTGKGL
jgi:hypothetical protein